MRFFLSIAIALGLVGCGGGDSTNQPLVSATAVAQLEAQPFQCIEPKKLPNAYRATSIDLRRDDIGYTAQGLAITSLDAVKLMIDRAKCVGFDTAIVQTNVPIDIVTGLIRTDQALPRDFWKVVKYAKSIGMRVGIKLIPVDWTNDRNINTLMSGLPVPIILSSIRTFEIEIAKQAQLAEADLFYVGTFQFGIDTHPYQQEWQSIVDSVRSVYKGKLVYSNCWQCTNIVWPMVDIVAAGGDLSWFTPEYVQHLISTYKKPVIVDEIQIMALPSGYEKFPLWSSVESGKSFSIAPDYNEQQKRFENFFLTVKRQPAEFSGFVIGEYMPWLQNRNLQEPVTNIEYLFNWYDKLSHSLYNNIRAQTVIQQHLVNL